MHAFNQLRKSHTQLLLALAEKILRILVENIHTHDIHIHAMSKTGLEK
jgi:hypothetical protein